MRSLFRALFKIFSRVRIQGFENIPKQGAYIIAINHVSLFEAPFVLAFWPVPPEAAGASDLWEKPGISILTQLYGGIPVHRGQFDRKLIDKVLGLLQEGKPLLVAPEGTRSHNPGMGKAQPGIAYIASQANVPVLPVGIIGSTEDFFLRAMQFQKPMIEMRIGTLLRLPELKGKGAELRSARQENADLIMRKIALLLPIEYQGVYQTEI